LDVLINEPIQLGIQQTVASQYISDKPLTVACIGTVVEGSVMEKTSRSNCLNGLS